MKIFGLMSLTFVAGLATSTSSFAQVERVVARVDGLA